MSASTVTNDTHTQGKAGRVAVRARDIEVRNGTKIQSTTFAQGNAGAVIVQADGRVLVSGDGARNPDGTPGLAGAVMVSGRDIQVQGNGKTTAISSSTFAQGHAGPVTIRADAKVLVSGTGALIASNANESFGHGGKVSVRAPDLEVRNG